MLGKLIFIVIGALMIAAGGALFMQQGKLDSFKKTTCVIESSKVGVSVSKKDGHKSTMYRPKIVYSYDVDGKKYSSSSYALVESSSSNAKWAEGLVALYKEKTEHPCYYNPENPAECVLNPEKSYTGSIICGIFGVVFLLVGLFGKITVGRRRGTRYGYHHHSGGDSGEVEVGEYDVDDGGDSGSDDD